MELKSTEILTERGTAERRKLVAFRGLCCLFDIWFFDAPSQGSWVEDRIIGVGNGPLQTVRVTLLYVDVHSSWGAVGFDAEGINETLQLSVAVSSCQ